MRRIIFQFIVRLPMLNVNRKYTIDFMRHKNVPTKKI